jgi:hypothetical protein
VPEYNAWSACTKSCGTGSQERTRSISTAVAYGGVECPNLRVARTCNEHACAVHCVVSSFAA